MFFLCIFSNANGNFKPADFKATLSSLLFHPIVWRLLLQNDPTNQMSVFFLKIRKKLVWSMLIYKTSTRFLFKLSLKYWRMYPVAVVLIFSPFFLWLSAIQGTELQKGNFQVLSVPFTCNRWLTLSIQIFLKSKYFLINIHLLVFHCFDQYWQLQSLQRKVSGPEGHGFLWHKIVFLRQMSSAWKAFTSIKLFFQEKKNILFWLQCFTKSFGALTPSMEMDWCRLPRYVQ